MPKTASSSILNLIVGNEIREARKAQGLSQQALADRLDVRREYVTKVENGRASITLGQLHRIADALGEPLSIRIGDRETIPPTRQTIEDER